MSKRVSLRHMPSVLIKKFLKFIFGNLKVYIIRNRWIVSALYSVRLKDTVLFKPLSRVIRQFEEAVSVADAYSAEVADRVERSLEESANVSDAYSAEAVDREIRQLEETASATDEALVDTKGALVDTEGAFAPWLEETAIVQDAYNVETATRVTRQLQESVHTSDSYSIVKAGKVERRLEETVRVQEVGIQSAPWEEEPSKKLWAYYDFEKALVDDSALWFKTVNGRRYGGYVNEKGVGFKYEGVEKTEEAHVGDTVDFTVYEQWVRGTKYDGYTDAETIYNFVNVKYDGYADAETIYNFVNVKYDGYSESSVTI